METQKAETSNDQSFSWKVDDPAPDAKKATFWKELRRFYRTGEKQNQEIQEETSALLYFVSDQESPYPFALSDKVSIDLDENTPLALLNHALNAHQQDRRREFKGRLSELTEGLNRLLKVEDPGKEADQLHDAFDFAEELIAFDKMVELIPDKKGKDLEEKRLHRIQSIVDTMKTGLTRYHDQVANVVVESKLIGQLEKTDLLKDAVLITISDDVFTEGQALFNKEMAFFTDLIKAYRIATLEVSGDYDETIHDEYFEHFHWHRFLDEELQLFPPIVLVVEHDFVFNHLSSFSRLLASNQSVKIVVLNHEQVSVPNEQVSWEDASHQNRQELATLAISHRNVFTLQAGLDAPDVLYQGLNEALNTISPSVCHLSIPALLDGTEIQKSKAASAGRYFPRLKFDPNMVKAERLDISMNIQPDQAWPKYTLNASKGDAEVSFDLAFTYADYKASFPQKAKELMLIPSKYNSEHLIPLGEYLELDEDQLYGAVPYIWLTNDKSELLRAAVPYVWVVSCQERMNFWNYLQELGGPIPSQTSTTSEGTPSETIGLNEDQLAKIEEEAMSKAAERLITALLTDDELGVG